MQGYRIESGYNVNTGVEPGLGVSVTELVALLQSVLPCRAILRHGMTNFWMWMPAALPGYRTPARMEPGLLFSSSNSSSSLHSSLYRSLAAMSTETGPSVSQAVDSVIYQLYTSPAIRSIPCVRSHLKISTAGEHPSFQGCTGVKYWDWKPASGSS